MPSARRTITCAIPVLNGAPTLDWTLTSLLGQRDVDVRIIAVDGGSTDGTLEILARRGVEVRHTEPGNMYRAVNAGLEDATTPWVTYLNSDDIVYPTTYRDLIDLAVEASADLAYGDTDLIAEDGRFLYSMRSALPHELPVLFRLPVQGMPQPGTIFTRELYERLRGFDTAYRMAADADFFLRALQSGAKFVDLGRPVCGFRLHAKQQTVTLAQVVREEDSRIRAIAGGGSTAAARATLLRWRLRNSRNYLLRYLRTGSFRGWAPKR
jgi:glycosyltransferase involved in cell wall biosynthesis